MAFTNPPANDHSQIISLPVELQIKIYEQLDCLKTADRLRATCQHMHAIFKTHSAAITESYQLQILLPFDRFCSIIEQYSTTPRSICRPAPVWDLCLPPKSQFLVEILELMPYIDHYRFTSHSGLADWCIDWENHDRHFVWDIGPAGVTKSEQQAFLSEGGFFVLDAYAAKIRAYGMSENIEDFFRRQLAVLIERGELKTYNLPRAF